MDELNKISRVIERELPGASKEVLLVLDATTGQKCREPGQGLKDAAGITGIVLTKLDGTARGGVVLAINNELDVPVKFVGVGEQIDDLQPFDADALPPGCLTRRPQRWTRRKSPPLSAAPKRQRTKKRRKGRKIKMEFILASNNQKKLAEMQRILSPLGIEVKTAAMLGLELPEVVEDGDTFEANAALKARSACRVTGLPAIADDSGLCVDYLDGAPGIYSARFPAATGTMRPTTTCCCKSWRACLWSSAPPIMCAPFAACSRMGKS